MKDTKEIVKDVNSLIQLDIDAFGAYGQALKEIDVPSINERLSAYRDDHKRHVTELSSAVRDLHGEPPKFAADAKGFLIEKFTAIRSATGTEGALKAMLSNEKLTNDKYSKAVAWNIPADLKGLIEKNYRDEQRHLAYIEEAIERRLWDLSGR